MNRNAESESLSVKSDAVDNGQKLDKLSGRHIQFIAIGGAVGAGLFLGSGVGMAIAGPAILITYMICGVTIFLMARALGELALAIPAQGSFATYADIYLGKRAGFITGWSYWMIWVLVGVAEMTAAGIFLRHWFPTVPQWLPGTVLLILLYVINRTAVRLFGEIEFWMTTVKVVTIVGLIATGLAMIALKGDQPENDVGLAMLTGHGGFFPNGWLAILAACPVAIFAFGGTEMVGVAAAEAENPEQTLPKAINAVVIRILVFYVGSLGVIMMLLPWTEGAAGGSPYVMAFDRIGLPAAADIINLVVLTAVVSSCNSGIFATGRILSSLAKRGQAPASLAGTDKRGLPGAAIILSTLAMLAGVGMNYVLPDVVLGAVMAMVAALLLWTWAVILITHILHRRRHGAGAFAMPLSPWSNIAALLFVAGIVAGMLFDPSQRITVMMATVWFCLLFFLSFFQRKVHAEKAA